MQAQSDGSHATIPPKVPAVEPEFQIGTLVLKTHDRKGGFENSVKNINKW
jgi:hypothetical protein